MNNSMKYTNLTLKYVCIFELQIQLNTFLKIWFHKYLNKFTQHCTVRSILKSVQSVHSYNFTLLIYFKCCYFSKIILNNRI